MRILLILSTLLVAGCTGGSIRLGPPISNVYLMDCWAQDGDTLLCGKVLVRLTGFDAWEICETGGPEARRALQNLVDAGVTLTFVAKDKYGRPLADARDLFGRKISEAMETHERDARPRPDCR